MKKTKTLMYVDKEFHRVVKIEAAKRNIPASDFTSDLAKNFSDFNPWNKSPVLEQEPEKKKRFRFGL